ncbi:HAMP domain-containing sensor histidine kinase [Cupriavidus sp. AU9028]|uniref:sensor histidine kinase n=1 Tax=Cupriavidus sp. AU9028 TaxID=2871157 RepID=UPI001C98CEBB|nr:HAMP domain-containing sensor histidine kinase [Cupriavidus sp. AU9028]MBY4895875.1 HAMP domain-containing histidine kinase [Cupriavidus sp. AU9028]
MPEQERRSLRKRLVWAFFLLTTFVLMVLVAALFIVGEAQERDLIDEVVNSALDSAIVQGMTSQRGVLGEHLTVYRAPIGAVPPGMPAPVASWPTGLHTFVTGETEYHIGIREHNGERLYLFYDETGYARRMGLLYWSLALGGVLLSLLALWLGSRIARSVLRQFEQLASRITSGEGPLARADQDREVAVLARALDDYRARNAALIARERDFTANVSHELRTPLTRIRTSAELVAEGLDADGTRARRIVAAVDELERRLKGLLFLARGDAPPDVRDVRLRQLVQAQLEPYRDSCEARGVALRNCVPDQATVPADPDLLALLFDNLVRNAVQFTERGSIVASFEDGWLSLRDTGIGIPAERQQQVFDRHFRMEGFSQGSGLGLSIVREAAIRCGWAWHIDSHLGQGTEIRVKLA